MATFDDLARLGDKIRNWGRWGEDDQLGTLNLITPDIVAAAAKLVRRGAVFPLGVTFGADGVWGGGEFRRNPIHTMVVDGGDSPGLGDALAGWPAAGPDDKGLEYLWTTRTRFADDMIVMSLQSATQWDALSHVWYDGTLYNGFPASTITSRGATRNSIDQVHVKGIVSRGVLLDVARYQGRTHVLPNEAITPDVLDATADRQGVTIRSGDILLVRTGWWPVLAETGDAPKWRAGCPGLSWTAADWLRTHDVAAVASDNLAVEATRRDVDGAHLPLHLLCIRDMGLMFGEVWNLEALAADCAEDGRYEFQLVAPPLRITGAVGSPLNPIAMK